MLYVGLPSRFQGSYAKYIGRPALRLGCEVCTDGKICNEEKKGLGLDEAQSLQLSACINHGEGRQRRGLCGEGGEGGGRGVIKLGGKADDGHPPQPFKTQHASHTHESRDGAPDLRQHSQGLLVLN